MAALPTEIDRINALTTNARNTWFGLLGVLAFVGITLMSVEHIDFYGVDRATTLPLVNFDVPTRYFFVAAPILVAAIYGYFHLYLIRLWDALSVADAQYEGRPLGDIITPWLVTDAALHLRTRSRKGEDPCTTPRTMEGPAMVLNFGLAWAFGSVVLALLWWLSMPARTFSMTFIAGICLFAASFVGAASLAMVFSRMREKHSGPQRHVFATFPAMSAMIVALPLLIAVSHQSTMGSADRLAPISMVDAAIVERPAGWLPYPVAKAEYKDAWCARKSADCKDLSAEELAEFNTDWTARRAATLTDMRRPYWSDRGSDKILNWTEANLASAYLVGADLSGAQMEGAILWGAQMEGADLSGAQMEAADLNISQIFGLTDRRSVLTDTNLNARTNNGGALRFVDMTDALRDDKTDFRNAFLDASVIRPKPFEARMGTPCQWVPEDLKDQDFFSVWRWWGEQMGFAGLFLPINAENAPLPTPERLEELGLTDCEPNQPFGPMPAID